MANAKKDQELAEEALDKVTTEPGAAASKNKQKCRHRASVACASCRDRRIRVCCWSREVVGYSHLTRVQCVVPAGESECTQCKRSGIECIIRNDDERRR